MYISRREFIYFPPRNIYLPPRFITSKVRRKTCGAAAHTSRPNWKVCLPHHSCKHAEPMRRKSKGENPSAGGEIPFAATAKAFSPLMSKKVGKLNVRLS